MAKTLMYETKENLPGRLVYESFRPMKPGIIQQVLGVTYQHEYAINFRVEVRWKNGQISQCDTWSLQDFSILIEDHKRKAEKFSKMAEDLRCE